MKIVIGSAGRRNYLVHWFSTAIKTENVPGTIITTDANPYSAAATLGDIYVQLPPYSEPEYVTAVQDMLKTHQPDLYLSVNDYEIAQTARLIASKKLEIQGFHFFPDMKMQQLVEDKYESANWLARHGVSTPQTVLGNDLAKLTTTKSTSRYIVKHRYGSGSSGVLLATADSLSDSVRASAQTAPGPTSETPVDDPMSLVVVQQHINGIEYGVDAVFSAHTSGQLDGVLARRKFRMRSGETDQAVTVISDRFHDSVKRLGQLLEPRGFLDLDFIDAQDGRLVLIDINPRFGGGYPFMHLAGADVPRHYVRQIIGRPIEPTTLQYAPGIVGAKYEEVRRVGRVEA